VVGDPPRDRLELAVLAIARDVVLTRELPGRLDRLRPAGDEEDAVELARRQVGHRLRELDRARVRVRPVRVERQLAHLLERGLADLLAVAVADVDREEPGERVEVTTPLGVFEVAPVPADDDRNVGFAVPAHAREVEPQVVAGRLLELVVREPGDGCAHVSFTATCLMRVYSSIEYSDMSLP
jgi:hypothetical protein